MARHAGRTHRLRTAKLAATLIVGIGLSTPTAGQPSGDPLSGGSTAYTGSYDGLVTDGAGRTRQIRGRITFEIVVTGSHVAGRYFSGGWLRSNIVAGEIAAGICSLRDANGGAAWRGPCDRGGFHGSLQTAASANPQISISFDTFAQAQPVQVRQDRPREERCDPRPTHMLGRDYRLACGQERDALIPLITAALDRKARADGHGQSSYTIAEIQIDSERQNGMDLWVNTKGGVFSPQFHFRFENNAIKCMWDGGSCVSVDTATYVYHYTAAESAQRKRLRDGLPPIDVSARRYLKDDYECLWAGRENRGRAETEIVEDEHGDLHKGETIQHLDFQTHLYNSCRRRIAIPRLYCKASDTTLPAVSVPAEGKINVENTPYRSMEANSTVRAYVQGCVPAR